MHLPRIAPAVVACAALLFSAATTRSAHAAETVHLFAKDGKGDVKGETSQKSLGRADSIECVEFEVSATVPTEAGSGGTGRLQPKAARLVKRIDKASPRLMQDMVSGVILNQCSFKFFRPNPMGDGTTQQFYTINLTGARIISVRQFVSSTVAPATASDPPLEEVMIAYRGLDCIYVETGDNARWGAAPSPSRTKTASTKPSSRQHSPARRTHGQQTRVAAR